MIKAILFTLLAFCIINASAQLCPNIKCAKATEVCGPTAPNTTTNCGADSYCTGSASTLGVCVIPFKLGDVCSAAPSNCEAGTVCVGSGDNQICALRQLPYGYLYPGEGCSDDKQCRYSSPYPSISNIDDVDRCRGGNCKSIKTGDYCTGGDQCNYNNAYCGRTQQCTKYIKKGGACYLNDETAGGCGKDYDSACIPNGLSGDAGSCQKLHSRKAGEFCRGIDHCKEGLWCRKRAGDTYGTCSEVAESATLEKPCTLQTDCTADNNEICRCGGDGVQRCYANVRPKGYHGANKDYNECYRKKGCSATSGPDFNCIKDKCKSQYCKINKVNKKLPYAGVSCQYEGLCNSAFTLIASPVLALLAFVVVLAL